MPLSYGGHESSSLSPTIVTWRRRMNRRDFLKLSSLPIIGAFPVGTVCSKALAANPASSAKVMFNAQSIYPFEWVSLDTHIIIPIYSEWIRCKTTSPADYSRGQMYLAWHGRPTGTENQPIWGFHGWIDAKYTALCRGVVDGYLAHMDFMGIDPVSGRTMVAFTCKPGMLKITESWYETPG